MDYREVAVRVLFAVVRVATWINTRLVNVYGMFGYFHLAVKLAGKMEQLKERISARLTPAFHAACQREMVRGVDIDWEN